MPDGDRVERVAGSCLCGDVRFAATGRPYRVGICHCLDCRKHHGALFHASAIFPETAVTVEGETHHYAGRHFCPRCGSSVFGRSGDEVEVTSPSGEKGKVMLRRLNAGDQAAIQDMLRMSVDEGDTQLAMGSMRLLTVRRAVVSWDFGPCSEETIAQLEPDVFEQIFSAVEIGTPPTQEQAGQNGAETVTRVKTPKKAAAAEARISRRQQEEVRVGLHLVPEAVRAEVA